MSYFAKSSDASDMLWCSFLHFDKILHCWNSINRIYGKCLFLAMNLLQALLISTCMTGSKEESSGVAGIATKSFTLIIWLLISNWLLHVQFCDILIFPSYRWDFGLFFFIAQRWEKCSGRNHCCPGNPCHEPNGRSTDRW